MELSDKVTQLEDEVKILKNEVQAVLLDLRENYLNRESLFNPDAFSMANQPINIHRQSPIDEEEPDDMIPEEKQENELTGVQESANEPESGDKQELTASEETAHEEVKRAWRPEIEPEHPPKPTETTDGSSGKIDLATIAGLNQWVAESVKRLGCERTEAILNISEMMGHVTPELKNILVKFINPIPDEYPGKVTTLDYLDLLIKLGNLLGKHYKSEAALLSILCQENDHR